MKRRSFLALLGLAPAVTMIPAFSNETSEVLVEGEMLPPLSATELGSVRTGSLRRADGSLVIDLDAGVMTFDLGSFGA